MATELSQPLDLACGTLPVQLRNPDITYGLFRLRLKGYHFREALMRRSLTSDMRPLRKTLTYLRDPLLEFRDLLCIFEMVEAKNKYSMQIDHRERY